MSKGIDGLFDESYRELSWKSKNNKKLKIFQVQGIDIRIVQNEIYKNSYCPYSNPAHELFISLLNYKNQLGDIPSIDDISKINGVGARETTYCTGLAPHIVLEDMFLKRKLPQRIGEKINIDLENPNFCDLGIYPHTMDFKGYVHGKDFIIGLNSEEEGTKIFLGNNKGNTSIKELIRLDSNDALKVMKFIYFFSPNNELLLNIYQTLKR